MYAVIKTGGKQYRVAADDVLTIEKVAGDAGAVDAAADDQQIELPSAAHVPVRRRWPVVLFVCEP